MRHEVTFGRGLLEQLAEMDERIADAVAGGGCERCGGPLHIHAAREHAKNAAIVCIVPPSTAVRRVDRRHPNVARGKLLDWIVAQRPRLAPFKKLPKASQRNPA